MKNIKPLLANLASVFIQFVATSIITHHLSTTAFGTWSYLYGIFTTLASFVVFGSGALVGREFIRRNNLHNKRKAVTHSFAIMVVATLIAAPIVYFLLISNQDLKLKNSLGISIWISLAMCLFAFQLILSSYFIAKDKSVLGSLYSFMPRSLGMLAVATCSLFSNNILALWQAFNIGMVTLLIIFFDKASAYAKNAYKKLKIDKKYLGQGLIITLIGSNTQINILVDSYFLLDIEGTKEVGFFRLAFMISSIILVTSGFMNRLVAPHLGKYFDKMTDLKELKSKIRETNLINLTITIISFLSCLVFGRYVLKVFYGLDYVAAFTPLLIILAAYILKYAMGPVQQVLVYSFNEKIILYVSITGIIVNAVSDYLLIKMYGLDGCAISTGLVSIATSVSLAFCAFKKTKINTTIFA